MAVSFEKSRGYSLPPFEINQTTAYSSQNPNSNQHYRTNKLHIKETQQPQPKPEKFKCWQCQGEHLKKGCPVVTSQGMSKHPRFRDNKERQCKLFKSFQKKIPEQKGKHQWGSWNIWQWQFSGALESVLFWVQKTDVWGRRGSFQLTTGPPHSHHQQTVYRRILCSVPCSYRWVEKCNSIWHRHFH